MAPDSQVETFAALKLSIDTWRWAGVPFYIRAGKRLPVTATEVKVEAEISAAAIFDPVDPAQSDYFRFRLGPEVVISIGARVKRPGTRWWAKPVELSRRRCPLAKTCPTSGCWETRSRAIHRCLPAMTASRRRGGRTDPAQSFAGRRIRARHLGTGIGCPRARR